MPFQPLCTGRAKAPLGVEIAQNILGPYLFATNIICSKLNNIPIKFRALLKEPGPSLI